MACSPDFVQYIIDQCSGAGEIAVKKMMGDYCIYCDGVLFGLICDNNFYVKVTEPARVILKEVKDNMHTSFMYQALGLRDQECTRTRYEDNGDSVAN